MSKVNSEGQTMTLEQFLKKYYTEMTNLEIAAKFKITPDKVRRTAAKLGLLRPKKVVPTVRSATIDDDITARQEKKDKKDHKKKYEEMLERLTRAEAERDAALKVVREPQTHVIKPYKEDTDSEAVAFMIASDWHVEEVVEPEQVNGLNTYNMDIARSRADAFFRNGLKLVKIFQHDVRVDKLVLPLLGDFITGNIHDESVEVSAVQPIDATIFAQDLIASGIEHLLKDATLKEIIVPCHSGNHGRMVRERRHAMETGYSLEYMMYRSLALHFQHEPRVKFIVPRAYHSYMEVYDYTIRFHHGHNINYGGGVGGITIPVNKAIAQWDKIRQADLDIFGHFHQMLDGGKFIANGSLIGYNAYALSVKASAEPPAQQFFLIARKGARTFKTGVCPILLQ